VLIFFIAGLLYLLRFKRVDNLGAYSIPSETGLLIPSGYASYDYCCSSSLRNRDKIRSRKMGMGALLGVTILR